MDFRGLVWKRVWKITFFGLKSGQDLKNREVHPHQEFPGVPPGDGYCVLAFILLADSSQMNITGESGSFGERVTDFSEWGNHHWKKRSWDKYLHPLRFPRGEWHYQQLTKGERIWDDRYRSNALLKTGHGKQVRRTHLAPPSGRANQDPAI